MPLALGACVGEVRATDEVLTSPPALAGRNETFFQALHGRDLDGTVAVKQFNWGIWLRPDGEITFIPPKGYPEENTCINNRIEECQGIFDFLERGEWTSLPVKRQEEIMFLLTRTIFGVNNVGPNDLETWEMLCPSGRPGLLAAGCLKTVDGVRYPMASGDFDKGGRPIDFSGDAREVHEFIHALLATWKVDHFSQGDDELIVVNTGEGDLVVIEEAVITQK
ncbi:MAG: hypothetical protein U0946_00175 [Patescibacteria group bacterium]|nr:hypothetical protein [Patescibacteria group bacterium]